MKKFRIVSFITIIVLFMAYLPISFATDVLAYNINLSTLTSNENGDNTSITRYSQSDFEKFLSDYNSGNLPKVYITEFLFDGVGMVKTYDLDDFVESGNDASVKTLDITVVNINGMGNYVLTGEITGGMIAVNTNGVNGEINITLNGVKIDTDSKKAPAIFVYNKDINYTGCKVTIKTAEGSQNYIEGGKFKKVSLVAKEDLSNYTSKYSGENQTNYTSFTNYYGVYTAEQINNILFAKVTASNDDLADGDPYYFYKGAGAISSDIDLNFEGTGYLEVISKNKEGIETKGNLTFLGGTGDYVIKSEDDCLNTTTKSSSGSNARNALSIDVNSMIAIVDSGEDSDEGDAIDSNGTLTINGGLIVAIAHPGQDAGIDSENGTYINGGIVLATGDMVDSISSESKQNFAVFSFGSKVEADTLITLLDENENVVMSYKTDRTFTNLVYSSPNLKQGTYTLYKDGTIQGTETNGFYTQVTSYSKGTQLGYSSTGTQGSFGGGMNGGMQQNMQKPDNANNIDGQVQAPPDMENGIMDTQNMPQMPNNNQMEGNIMQNGKMLGEEKNGNNKGQMKQNIAGNQIENGNFKMGGTENMTVQGNTTASNKEFKITGISNSFSGIANYAEGTVSSNNSSESVDTTVANGALPQTGIILIGTGVAIILIIVIAGFGIYSYKKSKK